MNNNNNDIDRSNLFYKYIWNNFVLRNKILNEIRIYNNHIHARVINLDNFKNHLKHYKYKEYLKSIKIQIHNDDIKRTAELEQLYDCLTNLPKSVESVEFIDNENQLYKSIIITMNDPIFLELPNINEISNSVKSLYFDKKFRFVSSRNINVIEDQEEQEEQLEDCILNLPNGLVNFGINVHFNGNFGNGFFNTCLSTLSTLKLNSKYKCSLNGCTIPESVIHLELGNFFRIALNQIKLPSNLQYLRIGSCFDHQILENHLPSKLKVLKFDKDSSFNHQFEPNVLPTSLRVLKLGQYYNKQFQVDVLPKNLEILKFTKGLEISYNLPIIPNSIPNSVTKIRFPPMFNQEIRADLLPSGLKKLKLMNMFKQDLSNNLVDSIERLKIDFLYEKPLRQLSKSLVKLKMKCSLYAHQNKEKILIRQGDLPNTLTYLQLSPLYQFENKDSFPKSLIKYVACEENYLNLLPNSVRVLKFQRNFNQLISQDSIPSSVRVLKFSKSYNNDTDLSNKNQLEVIEFGHTFNRKLKLPPNEKSSIKTIIFNNYQNSKYYITSSNSKDYPIKSKETLDSKYIESNELPSTLTSLSLCSYSKHPLYKKSLPDSIKLLVLGSNISTIEINNEFLPKNLSTLVIRGTPLLNNNIFSNNSLESIYVSSENILFLEKNKKIINNNMDKFKFYNEKSYCKNGKNLKIKSIYVKAMDYKIIITDNNLFKKVNKML